MGKLVRYITEDGGAFIVCADTTDVVSRAEKIHATSAVTTAALGRLLTAASLMGSSLKSPQDSITLRISGDGPAGTVTAVTDWMGNVRGRVANPVVEIPLNPTGKLDVSGAVGKGMLTVIKDIPGTEPYVGSIELASGEIAEDITSYYAISEQIPTVCSLGVLVNPDLSVKAAGGYIIQLLPGADDELVSALEKAVSETRPISTMIDEGISVDDICLEAMRGLKISKLDECSVVYQCKCSRERTGNILRSLDNKELVAMANEDGGAEVTCRFCEKKYRFSAEELLEMSQK